MIKLDQIDQKILGELMRDADQSLARIAERVGLSQTPCWKRIQRLRNAGAITGRVAIVDPAMIGLGLVVFVEIEAPDHGADWRGGFLSAVDAMPEVMEVFRMAGDIDYLLRVVVGDMAGYDAFYTRLTGAVRMKNVTSRFAMEKVRSRTVYPLASTA
ncbi:MAG: transcriptional regulator [Rhodovulum sulfidophilum]|uniref:Transcriptional regulator n=1 Tax=Rhodovulum sulfidophilum TaxID=35806 RepID=A0A2W5N5M1_RHOSU|nr:MAG: transcriptional regulator [Rhodovulum sulfidophilum]